MWISKMINWTVKALIQHNLNKNNALRNITSSDTFFSTGVTLRTVTGIIPKIGLYHFSKTYVAYVFHFRYSNRRTNSFLILIRYLCLFLYIYLSIKKNRRCMCQKLPNYCTKFFFLFVVKTRCVLNNILKNQ